MAWCPIGRLLPNMSMPPVESGLTIARATGRGSDERERAGACPLGDCTGRGSAHPAALAWRGPREPFTRPDATGRGSYAQGNRPRSLGRGPRGNRSPGPMEWEPLTRSDAQGNRPRAAGPLTQAIAQGAKKMGKGLVPLPLIIRPFASLPCAKRVASFLGETCV